MYKDVRSHCAVVTWAATKTAANQHLTGLRIPRVPRWSLPSAQSVQTWPLDVLQQRTCEHPRRRAAAASWLTTRPSLYLDRAPLRFSLGPYRSFRATYRNYIARSPNPRVCPEVVHRKSGNRIPYPRSLDLDTSPTPVCPLFSHYTHTLKYPRV